MSTNYPPENANPLADRLAEHYVGLRERTAELAEALSRVPRTIGEDTVDRASAFVRQIRDHSKLIETTRENEKKEFLEAGRTVDGFFRQMLEQLRATAEAVERRMKLYLQAKADAERKVREEEAQRQREEADRLAAEARAARKALEAANDDEEALDRVVEAEAAARRQEEFAREADKSATARTADLARTRGAIGGTATLATTLDFDITNHRQAVCAVAELIDPEALARAVRAYTRTYKGEDIKDRLVKTQPLPGVKFHIKQTARVV